MITKYIRLWLICTLLISTQAFALQTVPVINNTTVSASVSTRDYNKIFINGDRIVSVMGTPNAYEIQSDNNLGQIYIKPLQAQNFRINLTTEQGNAYQLSLHVTDSAPDTIQLQPPMQSPDQAANWESETPYEATLTRLIKAMATGAFPDGYNVVAVTNKNSLPLGNVATVTLISQYQGVNLQGNVYVVTNLTNQALQLKPEQLYRKGSMAIALQTQSIAPKAQTRLFVVQARSV